MRVVSFRELNVYRTAYSAAMRVFEVSKRFPREETYSLTDQLRRSSRSVCANIAEGWKKRRYEAAFALALVNADAEASESQCHLQFARDCGYLTEAEYSELNDAFDHVSRMLTRMIQDAPDWCSSAALKKPVSTARTTRS